MTEVVLDSSVVIAVAKNERIDMDLSVIPYPMVMSAVNVAEVFSKLAELEVPYSKRSLHFSGFISRVIPFDEEQAELAGDLRMQTKPHGLSLGDRACLALAMTLKADVYTADRKWANVQVGIPIHLIRS